MGAKKCVVALQLILWPLVCIMLALMTMMMIITTIMRAWALFCFGTLKGWLWGSSNAKNDRPCCLFYFGRCIYAILCPFLVASVLASFYLSAAFAMMVCGPFFLAFYLTIGLIKYVYLLCTVEEIWQPG